MFLKFPREIATPKRQVVWSLKEFIRTINRLNTKKNLYTSLYAYSCEGNNIDYDKPIIDKIFFDLDGKSAKNDIYKLLEKTEKYKKIIIFSGGGFHLYILTKDRIFRSPNIAKSSLLYYQENFTKNLDLESLDTHVLGDIRRITRIPNTFNLKRKRFCIPVFESEIEMAEDLAIQQRKENLSSFIHGEKFLSMKEIGEDFYYQYKIFTEDGDLYEHKYDGEDEIDLKNVPPCIEKLLKKRKLGWQERTVLILYLKENAYFINETIHILKKYLTPKKFYHCVKEEKQPYYLYQREDMYFPTKEKLVSMGLCDLSGYCDQAKYACLLYDSRRKT
ncbi:MAG: hypothetical protein ACTSXD_13485 [Candidatus Heimdallarchaeaceae archaeon]